MTQNNAKKLLELLIEKEKLSNQVSDANKKIAVLSQELYDDMEDEGIDSIEVDGIKFAPEIQQDYVLSEEYKGQRWDEIGVFFKWLEEIGEDALIKTKSSVHPGTRKSFLKEYQEKGGALPDFIKETFFSTVKYNKSEIKRRATS